MVNHFCSWHISMRTWKKLAQKLEWEESMHIPRAEYAWKQKFASRHPPGTHIKIHILQIPILKFRTPFWHYQDNPLTPSIHCQDTIDFQLSIFNKENLYGGWVGWWMIPSGNITTSWLHLASWNLPDSQLSWESKMEPSVAISTHVVENNYGC